MGRIVFLGILATKTEPVRKIVSTGDEYLHQKMDNAEVEQKLRTVEDCKKRGLITEEDARLQINHILTKSSNKLDTSFDFTFQGESLSTKVARAQSELNTKDLNATKDLK